MAFLLICKSKSANSYHSFLLCCFLLIICLSSSVAGAKKNKPINIGAIIDIDSRVGKEQQIAMKMAVQSFNNMSTDHRLALHFRNIGSNPIQAVSVAEELIREEQVKVIIGLQTWEQSVLVGDVGKRGQVVPVISLASSSNRPLLMKDRWPFLLPMAPNSLDKITCIAAMIGSFNWRRVVAIYEENTYGGDSEMIAVLSEALQGVDADIESHLVLPPPSSVSDPQGMVRNEVAKLLRSQSRVFVVLRSSLSLAGHLFQEAKQLGLMGRDSVWIISDSVSNLLDSADPSFISSMQGALGIKTYYSEETKSFLGFKHEFRRNLRLEFPDEHNLEPGIHALQAYDAITAVSKAVMKLISPDNSNSTSISLLRIIRSNSFTGLSGDVHFHGEHSSSESLFWVVNVVGKKYKELGIWSSRLGFAESLKSENGKRNLSRVQTMQNLSGIVNWPGELNRTPKGWAMPTDATPMRIGVPGRTTFEEFVKVDWSDVTNKNKYGGFCINIFQEVLKILEQDYTLPYEFVPYNGSYDDLIDHVINKSFGAAVGDITVLANRSKYVDFTHPFAESGLSMLVQVKEEYQRMWMFMKPFTINMWVATFATMFYTMFVVWFMEHQTNPEFRGPWKDQLGTALWFTFSSLFFAHRETIKSNYSKAVLVMWLFLAFVLTSSYTASLTSMLTLNRIEPKVTNIEWVRRTNAAVGCDGDSFVKKYLQDVLELKNIATIDSPDSYPEEFDSGNITAAFLELPYQKVFMREHCNDYTVTGPTYRFGGQGFVFQKGSPIVRDFSKAILTLMENGKLQRLEAEWLGSSWNCSNPDDSAKGESLHLESFWVLFLISGSTSTICFLIFVSQLLKRMNQNSAISQGGDKGILDLVVELAPYPLGNGSSSSSSRSMGRAHTVTRRRSSSRWDLVSPADHSEQFQAASPPGDLKSKIYS